MLRMPHVDGWIIHLTEGMQVDVRLFSGVSIFFIQKPCRRLATEPVQLHVDALSQQD